MYNDGSGSRKMPPSSSRPKQHYGNYDSDSGSDGDNDREFRRNVSAPVRTLQSNNSFRRSNESAEYSETGRSNQRGRADGRGFVPKTAPPASAWEHSQGPRTNVERFNVEDDREGFPNKNVPQWKAADSSRNKLAAKQKTAELEMSYENEDEEDHMHHSQPASNSHSHPTSYRNRNDNRSHDNDNRNDNRNYNNYDNGSGSDGEEPQNHYSRNDPRYNNGSREKSCDSAKFMGSDLDGRRQPTSRQGQWRDERSDHRRDHFDGRKMDEKPMIDRGRDRRIDKDYYDEPGSSRAGHYGDSLDRDNDRLGPYVDDVDHVSDRERDADSAFRRSDSRDQPSSSEQRTSPGPSRYPGAVPSKLEINFRNRVEEEGWLQKTKEDSHNQPINDRDYSAKYRNYSPDENAPFGGFRGSSDDHTVEHGARYSSGKTAKDSRTSTSSEGAYVVKAGSRASVEDEERMSKIADEDVIPRRKYKTLANLHPIPVSKWFTSNLSDHPFISVSMLNRETEFAHVHCVVLRERDNYDINSKLYPTYHLILEHNNKKLLTAKKMKLNRTSNYHLFDMTRGIAGGSLSKNSGNYIGKLRSRSVKRTQYSLVTHASAEKEELAGMTFNYFGIIDHMKEGSQPRKMTVILPQLDEDTLMPMPHNTMANSLCDYSKKANGGGMNIFQTKDPVYENGNYRLNFHGRVNVPSVKNFQLVPTDDIDDIVCQFGKVSDDRYHLDYTVPLNAIQAFSLALCQFNL